MILLQPNDYYKVTDSLNKMDFNNYFAKSVVQQYVRGKIYVDNTDNPTVFYIYHPYGMSLLLGDYTNSCFVNNFSDYCLNSDISREKPDWLQIYPSEWSVVVDSISQKMQGVIEPYERVNFKFNSEKYKAFRRTVDLGFYEITETDSSIFQSMPGTVVPRLFWDSATDFEQKSIGFTLLIDNQPVSTAFASFLLEDILEIGIQTIEGLQGKGYSAATCCKLIDYSIENNLEPLWSCKRDNVGSMKLAQKLGFEIVRTGPYYKINF